MKDNNDHKHHVAAGVAGAIIGAGVAVAATKIMQDENAKKKIKAAVQQVKDAAQEHIKKVQEQGKEAVADHKKMLEAEKKEAIREAKK